MAKLSSETRNALLSEPTAAAAVTRLNERICLTNMQRFVTMILVVLDPAASRATIVNAGHMAPLVRRDWERVEKRAAGATRCEERSAREVARHDLRKAVKRLRYACEAVVPVFGPPAVALGAAAEQLQDVLGEHHDSVVCQQHLRQLGGSALLERLLVLEQQRELGAEAELDDAWRAFSEPRLREWLAD